jgi:hypothetical protein
VQARAELHRLLRLLKVGKRYGNFRVHAISLWALNEITR